MSAALEVGSEVVHVEPRYRPLVEGREILRTTITRETKAQWTTADGSRWRKSDGARVPQYKPGPRFIVAATDFDGAKAVRS